jgi:hypothetical protein
MSFLSPWFFLGLAALAGPLIAHLRRLSVKQRVRFSAVDFLEDTPPRSTRKRWEDLSLMALRMLALALFALAFARPYFKRPAPHDGTQPGGRRVAVLLDTSASMRRGGLFPEALKKAADIAGKLGPEDDLEILSFDRSVRNILSFDTWRETAPAQRAALLKQSLESPAPTWAETRLDEALRFAAEQQLEDAERRPFEVAVISDLQEGASLAALHGARWPAKFDVRLLPVALPAGPNPPDSAALHWIAPDPETAAADAPFQVQVIAPHDFPSESVRLVSESQPRREWTAPAPPGRPRLTHVPGPANAPVFIHPAGTTHPLHGVWAAPLPKARTLVALGGGRATDDHTASRYFLERALLSYGPQRVEMLPSDEAGGVRDAEVGLWIAAGETGPQWLQRMRSAVEAGAAAFIQIEAPSQKAMLDSLLGAETSITEARVDEFAVLGEVDRTHPLFAPFRPPQFSDFTSIRFWKYRRLGLPGQAQAKILARFEGGDPALIECTLGKGKLLISTFGWKPADGQWVLSSRCVPFLAACLEWSGGGRRDLFTTTPGEEVTLPPGTAAVRGLDGAVIRISERRYQAEAPGVYTVEPDGGVIVVNLARSESQFAPLDPAKLKALGVPMHSEDSPESNPAADRVPGAAIPQEQELESRQGVWRWLLAATLAVLLLETIWAGRVSFSKPRAS